MKVKALFHFLEVLSIFEPFFGCLHSSKQEAFGRCFVTKFKPIFEKISLSPEKTLYSIENIPALCVEIQLPEPEGLPPRAARRIGGFYRLQGRAYLRYCEAELLPRAAELLRAGTDAFSCCTAALSGQITCRGGDILSLHTDSRECLGGPPELLRRGDTWDTRTGMPQPLGSFFPKGCAVRTILLRRAEEEILRQEAAGIARYHEAWRRELRRSFNPDNFYLTERGIAYYWQMHAIAPRAEGIPTFLQPFGEDGCRCPWETQPSADASR